MLLLAPNSREVRIEVGYGLEGDLPDIIANQIIQNVVIPKLKEGNSDAALVEGAKSLYAYMAEGTAPLAQSKYTYQEGDWDNIFWIVIILIIVIIVIIYIIFKNKGGGWGGPHDPSGRGGGSGFGRGGFGGGFRGGGGSFGGGGAGGKF